MGVETQRAKAEALRELHKGPEILILPNAWNVGSARFLAGAGFSAMGTTSAGIAFALGYPDGERISREQMLDVVGRITAAVPLPVTADIEAGYGPSPEAVAETVKRAVEAGAVLPHCKNPQHLACSKRAATRKRHVSRPLQAHWAAFSLWGDKRGDKRPLGGVSRALGRRRHVAPQRPRRRPYAVPIGPRRSAACRAISGRSA